MKEWVNRQPETADEWSSFISEYVHDCEFGSSKFEAVNDFHSLQRLNRKLGKERLGEIDFVNGKSTLTPEERRGVILGRISLLEHIIEQKEGSIEGYASAYLQVKDGFDNLLQAASSEAKTNFPEDKIKQSEYVQNIFGDTLTYVLNSIVEKQNIDLA